MIFSTLVHINVIDCPGYKCHCNEYLSILWAKSSLVFSSTHSIAPLHPSPSILSEVLSAEWYINTLSRSTSCVLSRLLVWYTHTHAHSCRRPAKTPQYSSLRDLLNKIKNVSLSHTPTRTYTAADGPWCVADTVLDRRRLDALAGQVYMYIYVFVYMICIYIQICTHTCI